MFFRHLKFRFLQKQERHLSDFVFSEAASWQKNTVGDAAHIIWLWL